jgi:hypothetical protein
MEGVYSKIGRKKYVKSLHPRRYSWRASNTFKWYEEIMNNL